MVDPVIFKGMSWSREAKGVLWVVQGAPGLPRAVLLPPARQLWPRSAPDLADRSHSSCTSSCQSPPTMGSSWSLGTRAMLVESGRAPTLFPHSKASSLSSPSWPRSSSGPSLPWGQGAFSTVLQRGPGPFQPWTMLPWGSPGTPPPVHLCEQRCPDPQGLKSL